MTVVEDLQTRSFSVTVDGVAAIDSWIEGLASRWGLSEKAAFSVRLCIAELATNVLEHGIARSRDDLMTVSIDRLPDGVEVAFRNSRQSFDPTARLSLAEPKANAGGRGLMLLHAYALDLTYIADPDHNCTKFRIMST